MTEQELRKLNRSDLLELLLAQRKENEQLRCMLDKSEAQLADRTIKIDNAGSLAEASLQLSGIFAAAQESCQYYIDNIQQLSERQSSINQKLEEETRERCDRMVADAEKLEAETKERCEQVETETKERCERMESETKERCDNMVADAEKLEAETKERCERMETEAKERSEHMVADAQVKCQQYWESCTAKIQKMMDSYAGLQQAMNMLVSSIPSELQG